MDRKSKKNYKNNEQIMKDENIRQKWEELVKKHEEFLMSDEERWLSNYEKVDDFIINNKKLPNKRSKNEDEKKSGNWIGMQKKLYKKNEQIMKDEKIRQKWKELVNKHEELFMSPEEQWLSSYKKVDDFIIDNKKIPSERPKNEDEKLPNLRSKTEDEKKLCKWISHQKQNYKNKKHSMENENIRQKWEELVNKHQDLFMSFEEQWLSSYEKVDDFIIDNKNLPSRSSENKDEKLLGKWIDLQKKNYKNKNNSMKDENIRKKWEELVKKQDLIMSPEERWLSSYKKVDDFIIDNNNLPKASSKNEDEKKLGNWISTQKQNYKNDEQIMKDKNIRTKWDELVNKHEELFIMSYKLTSSWSKTPDENIG